MFPFFENYPGTDLHEIDLAYILKLCAELRASNTTLTAWKAQHEAEYEELADKVDGLINNLVDVISPWDSSIAYHVFSIVEYQGTNYIAIRDVPVGAMITNTYYWQPANTVLEQINAIGTVVSDLQEDVAAINDKKNYILIGDSYPERNDNAMANYISSYLAHGVFYTHVLGGAGFAANGQGKTYLNLLNDAIAEVTEPDKITDILVIGGCNDADYQLADVNTAKMTFLAAARAAFVNATIHVFCVGGFIDPSKRANLYQRAFVTYSTNDTRTIGYPDANIPMLSLDYYESDGIHPNGNGILAIARYITSKFNGASAYRRFTDAAAYTMNNTPMCLKSAPGGLKLYNRTTNMTFAATAVTANSGFTYDMGAVTNGIVPDRLLSNLVNGMFNGYRSPIIVKLMLSAAGGAWMEVPGELVFAYDSANDNTHAVFIADTAPTSGTYNYARFMKFSAIIDA